MKENNSNRTCLVTGEEKNKEELLRFTLTPDRQVIPDFKKKLPGKGFYITNSRAVLAQAVSKNVFKKFGKNTKVDPNLGETVENILKNRALDAINLAKKAGALITGFEKVRENLLKGWRRLSPGTQPAQRRHDAGRSGRRRQRRQCKNQSRRREYGNFDIV